MRRPPDEETPDAPPDGDGAPVEGRGGPDTRPVLDRWGVGRDGREADRGDSTDSENVWDSRDPSGDSSCVRPLRSAPETTVAVPVRLNLRRRAPGTKGPYPLWTVET